VISDRQWEKLLAMASPRLVPGENVEKITFAQTYHPAWLFSLFPVSIFFESFGHKLEIVFAVGAVCAVLLALSLTLWQGTTRYVVTTNRRILIWASAKRIGRPPEFVREMPRNTSISSPSESWWRSFDSLGERLYLTPRWGTPAWRRYERISSIH